MFIERHHLVKRTLIFLAIGIIAIGLIHLFSESLISRMPTFNPLLFPVLTVFINTSCDHFLFYGHEVLV